MRERTAEPSRIFSIYLPISLYQKLLAKAGKGKLNIFVKQVLEEKLKEEQNQKEKLKQQLIKDYQSVAKSQKRKAEDEI
jgi:capsular polysaccharide biosynthesis protein